MKPQVCHISLDLGPSVLLRWFLDSRIAIARKELSHNFVFHVSQTNIWGSSPAPPLMQHINISPGSQLLPC
ncbi:conserved hypothetical protein [Ricinus communis]|uniref:Uncharacterized protein n=1 Tax=Ricinus communis TaxID=3988 RepID=B9SZT1_RICCO|nr:conserved hypothetical protein [Ricinus communis]